MSYNFLDKTGLTYFWGKIKDYISKITRNDLAIISSKEYSGIYGSANDQAGASFYFATIRPNNFYQMWRVKFRVYANVPNQNEYIQYSEVEYYGNKSDIGYKIFNRIANTGGRCFYYNNLCRVNLTGYNAGYAHIAGMGLRQSNNPTNSSYPRTFKIELLETENCTFTFYDSMKKIANISEYSTTNYAGIGEYDACNNGLRETGDDTNIWQLRHNNGNFVVTTALYRYIICLQKNETTLIPMNAVSNSTATTKTLTTDEFNPFGAIVYYNSTTTVNANASVGASALFEQIGLDLRYSFNTGTTLTAHKDVFLVAVPQSNGKAKLHSTPITQTLPTSENGLIYIHLGRAYSNYQIELYPTHLIYEYRNGSLRLYTEYDKYAKNLVPSCIVGSDNANSAGWYKIASSTLIAYHNQNLLYYVRDGYYQGYTGILNLEMRGADATTAVCWNLNWLTRSRALPNNCVRLVIDGLKWTLYFKRTQTRYGRAYFTELSNRNINGDYNSDIITYYNSTAPEETEPSSNISSSDGVPYLTYTASTQNVAGNSKSVAKVYPETLYVPNGLIMGGTAQAAGLITRGICGIGSPNKYGACSKENLYINFDGTNDFNSGRQIVASAGSIGSHLGSNMYQYTLPRGEIVKNWVESKGYTSNTGTITGVSMNGTSIATSGVANIVTNTAYNSNTNKIATMNDVLNNKGAENPIATILAYAGSEAPNGYLLCRGQAVSRTTYSLLFNAIGTQYGSGDGSTTFNIPDLQGKVIAGLDIVDEDFNVLGKTGGSKTVQLTKNQLPKINGSFTMHGAGTSTPVSSVSGDFTSDYNNTKYKNGGTEASGAGSKGNVKLVIGNDEAHENKQPYNTLNYIIKAYSGTDMPVPVESSSVKNSYDDSVANVYSTNYINTRVRGKKLWTNPNPTSNFAAQTITFDETNDYDFYKIKIKYGTDEGYAYNWQDVEVGDIFNLLLMWSYTPDMLNPNAKGYVGTGFRPECSCNHNSITFTNAVYYTSMDSTKSVNDTSHCIPLEIYGYYI